MASKIIANIYRKIIIASVGAVFLAFLVVISTGFNPFLCAVLLAGILANFGWTYYTLDKAMKDGKIVTIYGVCISAEEVLPGNSKVARKVLQNRRLRYRFLIKEQSGSSSETEDEPIASIYIVAPQRTFVLQEAYCLLFKRTEYETDTYSEKNLLGHDIVAVNPVVIPVNQEDRAEDKAENKAAIQKLMVVEGGLYNKENSEEGEQND